MLRILVGLMTVVVALFLLGLVFSVLTTIADVILLFFLAWVITFLLEPVALFLIRRGFPRVLAVALVYLALLIVISGAIVLTIPTIQSQVQQLADELRTDFSAERLSALNTDAVAFLQRLGLSPRDARNAVDQLSRQIPERTGMLATQAVDLATTLVTSILSILFNISLVVIISFYMMLDGGRLVESVIRKLPPAWVPDVRMFQRHVNETFGGFFRAQLIIAAIYGLFTWIVLFVLGQQNGLLASILAGLIMMIPFIGSFLAFVPPLLLVLLQSPPDDLWRNVIILVVLLVLAQQIALNLIAPRVFGQTMGVNPLILFAGLLLGAKWGGVWGAFFAGPIVAVLYAMAITFYDRWARTSPLFKDAPPPNALEEPAGPEVTAHGALSLHTSHSRHPSPLARSASRQTATHVNPPGTASRRYESEPPAPTHPAGVARDD